MTDNMLGGDATRLGDVLTIRNGKTVEILNTDAEGRLILADGLSLASEAKPDAVIDLATLTGAAMVSLGKDYSALMSNSDDFAGQVEAAAADAGELTWRMPLPARYLKLLDSPIADMKNIGGAYGGAITAALFLQEFVAEGIAWAHLDIAGPAFADSVQETGPKGGTGYGVRTLISLITNFTKPQV
jgi:leucyl aminopeptidase